MKKIIVFVLSFLLCAVCLHAQLLWKVEGNGLSKPSYIMGTYHLAKVSFVDSVPGLKSALAEAEQVYGEMNMQDEMTPENVQKMQAAMMLSDGKTLDDLLSPEQMKRLNAFLSSNLGFDLSNPMLAPMKQMTPSALNTQIQVLMCVKLEEGFNLQEQFDSYFQQEAQKAGKKIGGFETMEQQISTLLQSTPLERQVEQLMCLVDNAEYQKGLLQRTIKAFYAQDLEAIDAINVEKMNNTCDSTPEEDDTLIYNRNAEWAKQLATLMAENSTFVAVGAAHLPGERGLLNLLRQAGYSVSPVK